MLKYENETLLDRPNHIYFVVMKKDKSFKLTDYKRKLRGNVVVYINKFDKSKKKDCFDYFLKRRKYENPTQIVLEWEVILFIFKLFYKEIGVTINDTNFCL